MGRPLYADEGVKRRELGLVAERERRQLQPVGRRFVESYGSSSRPPELSLQRAVPPLAVLGGDHHLSAEEPYAEPPLVSCLLSFSVLSCSVVGGLRRERDVVVVVLPLLVLLLRPHLLYVGLP